MLPQVEGLWGYERERGTFDSTQSKISILPNEKQKTRKYSLLPSFHCQWWLLSIERSGPCSFDPNAPSIVVQLFFFFHGFATTLPWNWLFAVGALFSLTPDLCDELLIVHHRKWIASILQILPAPFDQCSLLQFQTHEVQAVSSPVPRRQDPVQQKIQTWNQTFEVIVRPNFGWNWNDESSENCVIIEWLDNSEHIAGQSSAGKEVGKMQGSNRCCRHWRHARKNRNRLAEGEDVIWSHC